MLGRKREGRVHQACSHAAARHRDAFLLLSLATASPAQPLPLPLTLMQRLRVASRVLLFCCFSFYSALAHCG